MSLLSHAHPTHIARLLADPNCLDRVVGEIVMPLAQELDPTDTGCYIVVWQGVETGDGMQWFPAVGIAVGSVAPEKMAKYARLAHEKAERLAANPDHIASFQTWDESDPANPKYPGAVRMDIDNIIISCSGLDWKFDEMVCMQLGWQLVLLRTTRMWELVQCSNNEHALAYFKRVNILI